MAKMTGFIFQDRYLDQLSNLSDQEVGRLVRACAMYHRGEEPQELKGRESMAFDFIRYEIDQNEKSYESKCETNKRNRQRASTVDNDCKRTLTNDDERQRPSTNEANINIKENKINIYDDEEDHARASEESSSFGYGLGGLLTDEDLQKGIEEQQSVDRLRATWEDCGCKFSDRDEKLMHDYLVNHTEDQIKDAIVSAHDHNARGNWKYIEKVLNGGDNGRGSGTAQGRKYQGGNGSGGTETTMPDWYPEQF